MGLIRKIASFLGLSNHDHDAKSKTNDTTTHTASDVGAAPASAAAVGGGATRSFGVKIPVVVEKPNLAPLIVPCDDNNGGIQGFKWYTSRLRIDEDGDVADEFLEEVIPNTRYSANEVVITKLQTNYKTLPTAMAMRKQVMVADGNLCQRLEYNGAQRWV